LTHTLKLDESFVVTFSLYEESTQTTFIFV
jgi:hypothetical protein